MKMLKSFIIFGLVHIYGAQAMEPAKDIDCVKRIQHATQWALLLVQSAYPLIKTQLASRSSNLSVWRTQAVHDLLYDAQDSTFKAVHIFEANKQYIYFSEDCKPGTAEYVCRLLKKVVKEIDIANVAFKKITR